MAVFALINVVVQIFEGIVVFILIIQQVKAAMVIQVMVIASFPKGLVYFTLAIL